MGMGAANSTLGSGCIDPRPTFRSSFKGHCANKYLVAVIILSALKSLSLFLLCELVFRGTIIHEWGAVGLCGIYAEGDRNMNMDDGRGRLGGRGPRELKIHICICICI